MIAIHPLIPWLAIKGVVVSYGYTEHSRQHHATESPPNALPVNRAVATP